MTAVLITVCDGTVDYCTDDSATQVVVIDFDRYDLRTAFPDDVDNDLRQLRELPDMPWTRETIRRLSKLRTEIGEHIRSEAPPPEEDDDSISS